MKVLMINGSPRAKGCTYTALTEVGKQLTKHGIEWEIFHIGSAPVAGCIACAKCATEKKCVFDDGVNQVLAKMEEFDGLILGAPVYYAGVAGQMNAFCDRLFYASRGRFARKVGAAVVSCRRGGASAAFDRLNKYFTIAQMPIASSQYWNQVHGNTPEEVLRDEEGMQTMRTLGENMAWLLKCIEAGKKAGVPDPIEEPKIRTNFIR